MKTLNTYAVVTGASKGLGKAFTLELASRGKNLLLLALKGEGLEAFCDKIRDRFSVKVHYLEVDFIEIEAIDQVRSWINGYQIDMLINNAGLGGSNYFDKAETNYIDSIIQINVRTLSLLTHLLVPVLKQHTPSYVLNVASMASFSPIAFKTVYPASKAFVYSFSRSLAEELKSSGVNVSVVLPGPMKTNADNTRRIEQKGWWVRRGIQTPEEIATVAIKRLFRRHKVIIPGIINKINWLLLKILPNEICVPYVSKLVKQEIVEVKTQSPKVNELAVKRITTG